MLSITTRRQLRRRPFHTLTSVSRVRLLKLPSSFSFLIHSLQPRFLARRRRTADNLRLAYEQFSEGTSKLKRFNFNTLMLDITCLICVVAHSYCASYRWVYQRLLDCDFRVTHFASAVKLLPLAVRYLLCLDTSSHPRRPKTSNLSSLPQCVQEGVSCLRNGAGIVCAK